MVTHNILQDWRVSAHIVRLLAYMPVGKKGAEWIDVCMLSATNYSFLNAYIPCRIMRIRSCYFMTGTVQVRKNVTSVLYTLAFVFASCRCLHMALSGSALYSETLSALEM